MDPTLLKDPGPTVATTTALPSAQLLEVGASVTWMHARSNGRSIGFSTRRGKIVAINRDNGMAMAKATSGKTQWLPIARFRSASARTELTEFIAGKE